MNTNVPRGKYIYKTPSEFKKRERERERCNNDYEQSLVWGSLCFTELPSVALL